jgi:hypothetical protein
MIKIQLYKQFICFINFLFRHLPTNQLLKTMTKQFFYDLQQVTNDLIDYRNELHDKKQYNKVQEVNKQIRKNIKLLKKHS